MQAAKRPAKRTDAAYGWSASSCCAPPLSRARAAATSPARRAVVSTTVSNNSSYAGRSPSTSPNSPTISARGWSGYPTSPSLRRTTSLSSCRMGSARSGRVEASRTCRRSVLACRAVLARWCSWLSRSSAAVNVAVRAGNRAAVSSSAPRRTALYRTSQRFVSSSRS